MVFLVEPVWWLIVVCSPDPAPDAGAWLALTRPNILMFGDWNWLEQRSGSQQRREKEWLVRIPVNVTADSGIVTGIPANVTEGRCCAI